MPPNPDFVGDQCSMLLLPFDEGIASGITLENFLRSRHSRVICENFPYRAIALSKSGFSLSSTSLYVPFERYSNKPEERLGIHFTYSLHVLRDARFMKRLVELSNEEAKQHFIKGSSYFNGDMPSYISFDPILSDVDAVLGGRNYPELKNTNANPCDFQNVNYNFIANKDGRFAWRPLELMHPAIYVSLINVVCESSNWEHITQVFSEFEGGAVDCCSAPVISVY